MGKDIIKKISLFLTSDFAPLGDLFGVIS